LPKGDRADVRRFKPAIAKRLREAWGEPTLPLSVLSGALKIADKVTVAMEALGNKIRLDSQGCEDARIIGDRQVRMVVTYKGAALSA
jgi:hypothetical protein